MQFPKQPPVIVKAFIAAPLLVSVMALGLLTSLPLAANTAESAAAEPAVESAVAPGTETEAEPAAEPERKFSEGMYDIRIDGSSLESFNASLAEIEKKVTPAEYTSVKGAVEWLLMYDLTAKRDRTKLAQNLDGLTGAGLLDRIEAYKRG